MRSQNLKPVPILIRATARLRKHLRQPAKPPEPATPPENPLGEWYADIDFLDREPFVLLLNAATGAGMVLPGRAADLRGLHLHARRQLALLLMHYGFDPTGPLSEAELQAWAEPPVYAATRDRSLLGSMNQFKDMAWHHFVSVDRSLPEAAAQQWEGFFRHPSLAVPGRRYDNSAWQRPLDLVAARLLPAGLVVPERGSAH
jgi:hypothetical protein